jgi:hypothetical protein
MLRIIIDHHLYRNACYKKRKFFFSLLMELLKIINTSHYKKYSPLSYIPPLIQVNNLL